MGFQDIILFSILRYSFLIFKKNRILICNMVGGFYFFNVSKLILNKDNYELYIDINLLQSKDNRKWYNLITHLSLQKEVEREGNKGVDTQV